jgi:DNA-binding beta-propeller fold protein YncE
VGEPLDAHRHTDEALAVGVSPNGTLVYVTGRSQTSGSFVDFATVAYDASTGAQRWVERYDGPGDGGNDEARGLAVDPGGTSVYVVGLSYAQGNHFDFVTVAYSP